MAESLTFPYAYVLLRGVRHSSFERFVPAWDLPHSFSSCETGQDRTGVDRDRQTWGWVLGGSSGLFVAMVGQWDLADWDGADMACDWLCSVGFLPLPRGWWGMVAWRLSQLPTPLPFCTSMPWHAHNTFPRLPPPLLPAPTMPPPTPLLPTSLPPFCREAG